MLVQYDGECCRLPPVDPVGWEGAVCATNGRTYHDTAVISLMRKFGQCKYQTLIYDFYIIATASLSYSSVVITRILKTLQIIYWHSLAYDYEKVGSRIVDCFLMS